MPSLLRLSWRLGLGMGFGLLLPLHAAPVKVTLAPDGSLIRGDTPYFIKGAGGQEHLEELVKRGGNSVRTWGERELDATLEKAQKLGLTVCAGVWLEPECSWFSYHKPEHCEKQLARVREIVKSHRDHSQLLLWGLGNEQEGDGRNADYWKQINRLAKMVHEEDPAHPCCTAVAGLSAEKAQGLNEHAPDLDFVGINTYGALHGLRSLLERIAWKRPFVVTEFGAQGFWESPHTPWKAPVEQTSAQKAAAIRRGYVDAIAPGGRCWGGYAFLWDQKQEATSTWFGLFTQQGESTATVDLLEEMWTGKAPLNRAPEIQSLKSDHTSLSMKAGETFQLEAKASDPEGDTLEARWEMSDDLKHPGPEGRELPPPLIEGAIAAQGLSATITAPQKPGPYRVFLFVSDDKGHAATANVPFEVK